MIELKEYVDGLFQNQPLTPEVKDLKEEILSNMLAKREDLIAQGLDVESATEKTKKSMLTVDSLMCASSISKLHNLLVILFATFVYVLCSIQLYRTNDCYCFWLRLHFPKREKC